MPSNTARNTLSRQWELLKLLPTHGSGATARSLQEKLAEAGFRTTKRTVERDLEDLATVFAIRRNDSGVPYGFSWTPPSSLQLSSLTVLEALTLGLVHETLLPLVPAFMLGALQPRFEQARAKLDALGAATPAARWPGKVASMPASLPLCAPKIDSDVLGCMQEAVLSERQLGCRYYSAHRNQTHSLVLNPLGLVQRGTVTYLIATAEPYADIRQFAAHRLSEVSLQGTRCQVPAGFDLKQYMGTGAMQFGDQAQETITLEAWVSEGLLRLLRETPLSPDMETMTADDGGWIRAEVRDSWELEWWLLSHTGSIMVTAPEALKLRLTQRLKRGLELYES